MSEISFFEVFAGTAVRSRPSSGRVSASSPCPSVPSRGALPFLFPSCPFFSCACSFLESPRPCSVVSSAPGPVASPCVPVRVPLSVFRGFLGSVPRGSLGSGSCCVPLRLRSGGVSLCPSPACLVPVVYPLLAQGMCRRVMPC